MNRITVVCARCDANRNWVWKTMPRCTFIAFEWNISVVETATVSNPRSWSRVHGQRRKRNSFFRIHRRQNQFPLFAAVNLSRLIEFLRRPKPNLSQCHDHENRWRRHLKKKKWIKSEIRHQIMEFIRFKLKRWSLCYWSDLFWSKSKRFSIHCCSGPCSPCFRHSHLRNTRSVRRVSERRKQFGSQKLVQLEF